MIGMAMEKDTIVFPDDRVPQQEGDLFSLGVDYYPFWVSRRSSPPTRGRPQNYPSDR